MSNHRNEFLDLHFASVAGTLLSSRPQQGPAAQDAEPEVYEPQQGALRRLVSAIRHRRDAGARAQTGRV
jgi:hypothetical protein